MRYKNILEEELKNKVAKDFFDKFDCTSILNFIDFAVKKQQNTIFQDEFYLWAEAKASVSDVIGMLTQLILTIGKARTFDKIPPPPYLGCFDNVRIAFIPYDEIQEIFFLNDFNWNVAPSNTGTREYELVYAKLNQLIDNKLFTFDFERDEKELRTFIKDNFDLLITGTNKIQINKNNFKWVYDRWLVEVKPSINLIFKWDEYKNEGIMDADFYLADLMAADNVTLGDNLFVLLSDKKYILEKEVKLDGRHSYSEVFFKDDRKAHTLFWTKYERPPKEEYRDYIVARRDLLVPQDIRERKGSFFTPQIWVELSQKYIADVFGEDWQEEYFVWDCAAGTGNLLAGLTESYRLYASTLDRADVAVMHERIEKGANLIKDHCFQFDFLNDEFSKLPESLRKIIKETPEKLIVYINPPYAEVSTVGGGKAGVNISKIHSRYTSELGTAGRELYTQFLTRIYFEIKGCKIAEFSKLKTLQGSAFEKFRSYFKAKLMKTFVVPASSFDNVKGSFPIGFKIWDTGVVENFVETMADVFDSNGAYNGKKSYWAVNKNQYINKWISLYKNKETSNIGYMDGINGNDFQHNSIVFIVNKKEQLPNPRGIWINQNNLIPVSIYLTVRKILPATWLNDRDQFLFPNNGWETDSFFHTDCLTFSIFNNNIQSKYGINHWIPFTEKEVCSRSRFDSNFMTDFMAGKTKKDSNGVLNFGVSDSIQCVALEFSDRAKLVFEAGKTLWTYYHSLPNSNVNASFYDIREHFQGRDEKRMKNTSEDEKYNKLIGELRFHMKYLAKQIEPKIYEYGFLRE